MKRFAVAGKLFFLLAWATSSSAQQLSGRIDLDASTRSSELVTASILFAKTDALCVNDRGILHITNGSLRYTRINLMLTAPVDTLSVKFEFLPAVDDDAYRYRITAPSCRTDVTIRQQVREADGEWRSLPVVRFRRPGLSAEERREALQALQQTSRERTSPEDLARRERLEQSRRAERGSLGQGGVSWMSAGLSFEGAPQVCVEAFGDVVIGQDGVTLVFTSPLSADLNRFVIERSGLDDNRGRIYLARGDCRFELTVEIAVHNGEQWTARSIPPFVPPRVTIHSNPPSQPPQLDPKN